MKFVIVFLAILTMLTCEPKAVTSPEICLFSLLVTNSANLEDKRKLESGEISEADYQRRFGQRQSGVLAGCALGLRKTNVDGKLKIN
ncbi:hypothetical protein EHQ70_04220 [Leptospira congkakensis]|nr:hypothetical protein EHQ70_04220 [Leptospira congkakensis]